MGFLAPGSAHTRLSAWPLIGTSGSFLACLSAEWPSNISKGCNGAGRKSNNFGYHSLKMTASLIPRVILRAQLQTCQKNSPLNQRFQTHFDFQQAIEKLGVRVLGPIRKLEPDPIVCKHKVSMRRCVGCHNQENDILCFWSHSYSGCFLSHDYKDINYSGDNVCYALFCCC